MPEDKRTVGIVGHGLIGSYVFKQIESHPELGLKVVFVHDKVAERVAGLPRQLVLDRIEDFSCHNPDMVCELAHPEVSREYGAMFLEQTDYFLLSVTAMADAHLESRLKETAFRNGTSLFIPHGGVMGLDAIVEGRDTWDEVSIVMKKNPRNLDFASSGMDPASISGPTVLYDGPTRGVCPLFPRNVNTHATVALGGIGFDRTHSTLVADPALNVAIVEIRARGVGVDLELTRAEAITGVSGASTPWSVFRSILSTAPKNPGIHFC